MSKMQEDQLNQIIEMEKEKVCICKTCTNYEQCMDENKEALFCILGKSSCQLNLDKCLCTECPAHKYLSLRNDSYCLNGSKMEQRKL
jgi:hypothetical protein